MVSDVWLKERPPNRILFSHNKIAFYNNSHSAQAHQHKTNDNCKGKNMVAAGIGLEPVSEQGHFITAAVIDKNLLTATICDGKNYHASHKEKTCSEDQTLVYRTNYRTENWQVRSSLHLLVCLSFHLMPSQDRPKY